MTGRVVPYPKYGNGVGLRRTIRLCARLGIEPTAWADRACVVTGSNGKGSTAAMTHAVVSAHGVRTALFTSPHLHRFTERYRLDGDDITEEALARHWNRVRDAVNQHLAETPGDTVGGFEFIFLIALCWLEETRPEVVVFEAGIGGRYDPTRLLAARVTALVSLDLEHTDLLGKDLASIASDKIDACAPGGEVLVGTVPSDLEAGITEHSALADRQATFLRKGENWTFDEVEGAFRVLTRAGWVEAAPPLAGSVQAGNAALACGLAERLLGPRFDPAAARLGLAGTRWPGRLEVVQENPLTVIDVGHSPAAVAAALEGLAAWGESRFGVLICGASKNKDSRAMIDLLARRFDRIVCTAAAHNGCSPDQISEMACAANPSALVLVAETPSDAWATARSHIRPGEGIYVAGGLFLATEVRSVIRDEPLVDPFF